MKRTWTIIGVGDVPRSFKWYLLSWFGARAKHETSLPHKQMRHGIVKATVPNLTRGNCHTAA